MNRRWQLSLAVSILLGLMPFSLAAQTNIWTPPVPPGLPMRPMAPRSPLPSPSPIDSIIKWDAETKETTILNGVVEAKFTFHLTNASPDPVTILGVHTSCGCTAAKLPPLPWKLESGTNGEINVTMNVANKSGLVTKTVTVSTDRGPKILFVKTRIMPPSAEQMASGDREQNQKLALADRQAVFRGDCARCHSEGKEKVGKELYASVCGVCHEAEHRAAMVPDLHALTQPTNAEYWRNWITQGKPGTLMPAFSEKHEGILTDEQIESLVRYLTEAIPSKPAPTPQDSSGKSLSRN